MRSRDWARVCCGALLALAAAQTARAAEVWHVTGVFNDGTTLAGDFTIDKFGFIDGPSANIATSDFDYTAGNSSLNNTAVSIDFQPGFQQDLHITFAADLNKLSDSPDAIVGGVDGSSFECTGSFSCFKGSPTLDPRGTYRWLVSGEATGVGSGDRGGTGGGGSAPAPEPATWALMIAGMGLTGAALRRRRGISAGLA